MPAWVSWRMRGPFFVTLTIAAAAIRYEGEEETGRLRLAFIGGYLDVKLAGLIKRFREDYPASLVEVDDQDSPGQINALLAGELDAGFIGTRPQKPIKGLEMADWGRDPLLIAMPEKHPLARINKLRWAHLQGLSWVLISRQVAPAFRDQFSQLLERHALAVQIVQESNRIQAVLMLVAAGIGISMVAQPVKHLISTGVVFRQLPSPQPFVHYAFAYRTGNDSPTLRKFLALLRQSSPPPL